MNESQEKSRVVLCCFVAVKTIVTPSFSSNLRVKFICSGILVFACLDKSIPGRL